MLFQTGSQENGERAFQGRRIFRKSSNLAAFWRWEEQLAFLTPRSRTAQSSQGRSTGTSHVLGDWWCSQRPGCSENLEGCGTEHSAASQGGRQQPTAAPYSCIFIFIFFATPPTLGICIAHHPIFQFQPTFGYM